MREVEDAVVDRPPSATDSREIDLFTISSVGASIFTYDGMGVSLIGFGLFTCGGVFKMTSEYGMGYVSQC